MLLVFSTRKKNPECARKMLKSAKGELRIQEFVNPNKFALTECYNKALDLCEEDEILILTHDDVILPDGWDEKIINIFNTTDYGIIGVAGSCSLSKKAIWWENRADLSGIVSHEKQVNKKIVRYDTNFSEKHDFIMDVCCVDGVFIALKKNRIKKRFNENIKGFHFYDISFCVDNFLEGVKIGVTTSFKIHHKSVGQITDSWHINRNHFLSEYEDRLPIFVTPTLSQMVVQSEAPINPISVGVIILTKDKIDYLITTVTSLITKTSKTVKLNIVIGDTGSTEASLQKLDQFLSEPVPHNINIQIHYLNQYNFAKNNNEIAKKYFTEEELILFCNNDIELVNNALDSMINVYQTKPNCGTIGCRLLYPNLRIQHGGIVIYGGQNNIKGASHFGLKSFYSAKSTLTDKFIGCTGAFLLMNKKLFETLGGFNENTVECFEDVILNIETKCIANKTNYYDGTAVCIHHESITRNESPNQTQRILKDFKEVLIPVIIKHYQKLKQHIIII